MSRGIFFESNAVFAHEARLQQTTVSINNGVIWFRIAKFNTCQIIQIQEGGTIGFIIKKAKPYQCLIQVNAECKDCLVLYGQS